MKLPDEIEKMCIPDYGDAENYQSFLDLMTPEDRATAKPWEESKASRDKLMEGGTYLGKTLVSVPVTVSLWKAWCDTRNFKYRPLTVASYATWLYICAEVDENIENVHGLEERD